MKGTRSKIPGVIYKDIAIYIVIVLFIGSIIHPAAENFPIWEVVEHPYSDSDVTFQDVVFINETHGWAVGSDGTILRTTKGNEIGTRLWRGLTDYVILAPIGVTIIGIVTIIMLRKRHRRGKQSPQSSQPLSSFGIQ